MDRSSLWRLSIFLTLLLLLTLLERRWPGWAAPPARGRVQRANLVLGVIGAVALRTLAALVPVLALVRLREGFPGLPGLVESAWPIALLAPSAAHLLLQAVALVGLDLALYAQHRAFHRWAGLWRWHAVHHSDAFLDATSALRFHPLELGVSWIWKLAVALLLGATPTTLLAFEVLVNALALFNHSALRFSPAVETAMARWLITPAVHRLHHRDDQTGAAPNYGFSVPWWDRLLGSWQAAPRDAADMPPVGLQSWPAGARLGVWGLLTKYLS